MASPPASQRLLVTPGEPSGIGAEILVKAAFHGATNLITFDDPDRLRSVATDLGVHVSIEEITQVEDAEALPPQTLAVFPIKWGEEIVLGAPSAANAPQVIKAIDDAVALTKAGKAKGIVTCPIQKSSLYAAGFKEPGHTEYLGKLDGADTVPVMMLANKMIRVVPLTVHEPLAMIPSLITADMIMDKVRIIDMALRRDFGLSNPHIAVAGLNPHAGEGGAIGREEIEIIAPAIAELAMEGINISGPFSADTLFHEDRHQDYDAVLAMYHDQALIPVKTLDFHGSVNVTIGLSFIRTSPDHGTALDQAGKGTANPASLMAAIDMADDMANRRHHRKQ